MSNAALTPETTVSPNGPSGRDSLSPVSAATRARSPGPWRASFAGRTSPAPAYSSVRDSGDHPSGTHSGMTPLRSHSSGAPSSEQRQRLHPPASWQSSSKRGLAPSTTTLNAERSQGELHSTPTTSSSAFGSFSRPSTSTSTLSSSPSAAFASATSPGLGAGPGAGPGIGPGGSMSTASQTQPLKLEDLATKFADSKERFVELQISALVPASLADKERRPPMGSFAPSSSHFAQTHIKVQRTASLNQNSHSSLLSRGSGGRLLPGHLAAQPTDMRRTASHNTAFSSGLSAPLGSTSGTLDQNGSGHANGTATNAAGTAGSIQSNGAHSTMGGSLGSSTQLAPFSLSQMTRSPRRSSPNPPEHNPSASQDQGSPIQTSVPSPLVADKHPLQHTWTLSYDISPYSRPGSLVQNYENNLNNLGTFSTVELFARYFNWIEKPHKMEYSTNYHLFKDGIKPMWEDPANANGGRWIVTLNTRSVELLDRCWMELSYALVGEQLDAGDDICGAVLSRRAKADRLAVWVRDKENVEAVNGIGKRLVQILDLAKENIAMEFQITTETRSSGLPKKYISLETIKNELALEAQQVVTTLQSSLGTDATPHLTVDSASATPSSATAPSHHIPTSVNVESDMEREGSTAKENQSVSGTASLLISVEGEDDAL